MNYARKVITMGFMDKLLGNTSEAKLKKLAPLVKRINELEPATHALSDARKRTSSRPALLTAKKRTIYCAKLTPW